MRENCSDVHMNISGSLEIPIEDGPDLSVAVSSPDHTCLMTGLSLVRIPVCCPNADVFEFSHVARPDCQEAMEGQ